MSDISTLVLQGLQIVWINVLLSGDNAVVIALACRRLDARQRKWGILAGSFAAVALRILFTVFVVALLDLPFLKLVSGVLLFWIALRLLLQNAHEADIKAATSVWGAVRTIAIADAIMSLDNVVAVAAAAKDSMPLIIFGMAISVPLIVFGSTLVMTLLNRFPILIVAGAALLGWVAGGITAADPALVRWFGPVVLAIEPWTAATGAAVMLLTAAGLRVFRRKVVVS